MKKETFLKKLDMGDSCNYNYEKGEIIGLISIWKLKEKIILTWEETSKADGIYNEELYIKDICLEFEDLESLENYLLENHLDYKYFM